MVCSPPPPVRNQSLLLWIAGWLVQELETWSTMIQKAGALFTSTFEYFWRQGTIEYTLFLVFLWHVGLPIIFNKLKFQAIIFNTATTTCTSWTNLVRSESLVNTLPVQPRFPHYSRLSSAARSDLIWSMICQHVKLEGRTFQYQLFWPKQAKLTLITCQSFFPQSAFQAKQLHCLRFRSNQNQPNWFSTEGYGRLLPNYQYSFVPFLKSIMWPGIDVFGRNCVITLA